MLGVAENLCLASVPMVSGLIYGEISDQERMKAVDGVYLAMGKDN